MSPRLALVSLLPLGLGLAACAPEASYPSLAPRPIEGLSFGEPARGTTPVPPADPAVAARYAAIVEQAREGDAGFRQTLATERPAIEAGRAAPTGSDAWTAAQAAYSRLEAVHEPVTAALGTLDNARAQAVASGDRGDAAAAVHAADSVRAIDADERQTLKDLAPPAA